MAEERDDNRVAVAMGQSPSDTAIGLSIEHASGYLNALFYTVTGVSPASTPSVAPRDDNRVPTAMAQNPSGTIQAMMIDNRNGNLWTTTS